MVTFLTWWLYYTTLASVAQFDREMMPEQQREGSAKANTEKKHTGRAPTARAKADQVRAMDAQRLKKTAPATELSMSVRSVHRLIAMPREDVIAEKIGLGAPDAPRPR